MDFERFKEINDTRLNNHEMEQASVVSSYRNLGCGDGFRIYLQIDDAEQRITDASFTTTGCGFGLVSLAMACEWVKGKSLDEAAAIQSTDIEGLFAFPPRRKNYPDSAVEAMQKAVADYRNGSGIKPEDRVTRQNALKLLASQGHLRNAVLKQVILDGADLSGIDLSGADLSHAFLQNANLSGANLRGVRLRGAFLNQANLAGADLSEADLRWCKLSGANIESTRFTDARYDIGTRVDPRQTHIFESMIKMDEREIYKEQPAARSTELANQTQHAG
ncbi:MAG: pentapeptide repeat-containing protein [Leptospiraceae bacterium]|nr:pentapeptide repeat-containing protein [Leptospiraceae bacterium]